MGQEKFLEARLDYAVPYGEALNRILAWTDVECRLILFSLLMGFKMKEGIQGIRERRDLTPPDPESGTYPEPA